MAEKPFRVLLDLTELHLKNLKYVWINVSPRELKTIFGFKKSVLHKINLQCKDVKLFVRDGLLLDEETVTVLREDDTVKVEYDEQFPHMHDYAKKTFKENKKKLRKRKHSENSSSDNSRNSKNYKSEINSLTSDLNEVDFQETRQRKKHKKHSSAVDNENDVADLEKSIYKNNHKKRDKKKSITEQSNANVCLNNNSLPINVENTLLPSGNCVLETVDNGNYIAEKKKNLAYENSHRKGNKKKSITKQSNAANISLKNNNSLPINAQNALLKSENCVLEIVDNENNIAEAEKSLIYENSQRKQNKKKTCIILEQSTTNFVLSKKDNSFPTNVKGTSCKSYEFCVPTESVILKEANFLETINNSMSKVNTSNCSENLKTHFTESSNINTSAMEKSERLNNCPKKKRKRHRKRKQLSTNTDISSSCDTNHSFKLSSESVADSLKRKHIRYSLSPEKPKEDSCIDKANQLLTLSSDTFIKENKSPKVEFLNDFPKISTPAQSNDCGNLNWSVSLSPKVIQNPITCNEFTSCINESPRKSKQIEKKCASNTTEKNECTAEKLYEDLPNINSLPNVGTCIAYKVLELGENYCPEVTDYREGIIKRINPDTEEIEIELYEELIIAGRTGKFENLAEDEVPPSVVKKSDTVKWSDVLSPKLLSGYPKVK